ncbi:MAG: BrxA/BrxB family bacilliredoxin [Fibrobacterales bacterium]
MLDNPTYDPVAVQPFRDELTNVGFEEVTTPEEVDKAIIESKDKTLLVMLNSVCGCSAGSARPGICASLQNEKIPDRMVALFAGQEKSAISHLRTNHLFKFEPSSPNILLFADGKLIHGLFRPHIEQMDADAIRDILVKFYNEFCSAEGPSIPRDDYDKLEYTISCGSKIARLDDVEPHC